jgi:hypothetical protein
VYFEFLLLCFSICSRLVAVVDSCNLIWIIQRSQMLTETVLERYIFSRFWLDGIFFVDRSFTYKAHCVLWQLKWTDLLDLNCDPKTTVLLPSVPRRPRTYDPSRQLRRGYPVGLKTLMHGHPPPPSHLLGHFLASEPLEPAWNLSSRARPYSLVCISVFKPTGYPRRNWRLGS